jgi:hypothetical protein
MPKPTIGETLEFVLGRDFEISCKDIQVILRTRSPFEPPPLFAGPGFIRSNVDGEITFELLDQKHRTAEEIMDTVSILDGGGNSFVIEAEAYNGVAWLGSWLAPAVTWHDSGQPVIRGKFHQLTADFANTFTDTETNVTELHYPTKLPVPMTALVEQHTLRAGTIENKAAWRDRHQFDFGGARICLRHLDNPERTIASVGFRGGLPAPCVEAWLDETLSFLLGWHVHHRVAIRYLDKKAILFIRKSSVQERTGMPMPLNLPTQQAAFWAMFERYLAHCEKCNCFGPPCGLSHVWSEVLLASTGTVHTFVFALVAAIESLARQIKIPITSSSAEGISDLNKYVAAWTGNAELKQRAMGLLSQLNSVSMTAILKPLQKEGIVSDAQIKVWRDLRNKLAHGSILDYYNEDLVRWRNSLIEMAYRLALRQIGYTGEIFSHESNAAVNFP